MTALVKKNYIRYNAYRYYKGRAQSIELGDWGDKKTPATRANYLDQKGSFAGLIKDVSISSFKLSQKETNKINLVGSFSMAIFGLDGDDFYQQAMAGTWEFVEIHLRNEARFLRELNRRRARLEILKHKDSYRIVDSIIVVMKAREVRKLRGGHTGAFKGGWNGMSLTVDSKTRAGRATTMEIDPNTVYAYGLKKLKWDATRKARRSQIVDLKDDPHGL